MPEIYKEGQGVLVRRCAFWSLVLIVVWGGQSLYTWLFNTFDFTKTLLVEGAIDPLQGYRIPLLDQRFNWAFVISWGVVLIACFLLWRMLMRPRTADFLIDTDSELKKVTWPSWKDAWNSSLIVVLFVIVLTIFLVSSDFVLNFIFGKMLRA
jgi:preprotein translocase subunit SecE